MNAILLLFHKMRLRDKFLLCFVVIILLNTIGVGAFAYLRFSAILLDNAGAYAAQILKQSGLSITNTFRNARNISNLLTFDQTVQDVLQSARTLDQWSIAQRRRLLGGMEKVMVNHFDYIMMRSLLVIDLRQNILGNVFALYRTPWAFGANGLLEDMLRAASGAEGRVVWTNNVHAVGTVTLARMIRSPESAQPLGYLLMDIDAAHLRNTMASIELEPGWSLSLADEQGALVVSTVSSANTIDPALHKRILQSPQSGYFVRKSEKGVETLYCFYRLQDIEQYLIGSIPVALLNTKSQRVATSILTIGLILIFFSILLALIMTRSVIKPLGKVVDSLKRVTAGDLDISIAMDRRDEIGELSQSFNAMVEKTKALLNTAVSAQILQKEAEFKALQAQINPHFLYNALETINWMAKSIDATDICHMVNALGSLMRASISSKKEFVCVKEELRYVTDYIYIQNMRYGGKIRYEIDVEPALMAHVIPKLIIQPIVENAITHGLEQKTADGCLRICGFSKDKTIRFVICDDGVGMEQARADGILANPSDRSAGGHLGMGLNNVCDRIRLYYGREYGLAISSIPNVGTTVQIILPEETRNA